MARLGGRGSSEALTGELLMQRSSGDPGTLPHAPLPLELLK